MCDGARVFSHHFSTSVKAAGSGGKLYQSTTPVANDFDEILAYKNAFS